MALTEDNERRLLGLPDEASREDVDRAKHRLVTSCLGLPENVPEEILKKAFMENHARVIHKLEELGFYCVTGKEFEELNLLTSIIDNEGKAPEYDRVNTFLGEQQLVETQTPKGHVMIRRRKDGNIYITFHEMNSNTVSYFKILPDGSMTGEAKKINHSPNSNEILKEKAPLNIFPSQILDMLETQRKEILKS